MGELHHLPAVHEGIVDGPGGPLLHQRALISTLEPGDRLYRGQTIREHAWGARVEVEEALAGSPLRSAVGLFHAEVSLSFRQLKLTRSTERRHRVDRVIPRRPLNGFAFRGVEG